MSTTLSIDFVSDVVCPWCVIGLRSLKAALAQLDNVEAEIICRPFELNPAMGKEGQNLSEHIQEKYGASPEQSAGTRQLLKDRGAALDFTFNYDEASRIWNTFDAHRLLHWAEEINAEKQLALKEALFAANFTEQRDVSDPEVLLNIAAEAGFDRTQAAQVLEENRYAEEVREDERFWMEQGIHSVPAVIINRQYLISGGQPVEAFLEALEKIASEQQG
ncbi:DsbA family oxidoreductase [Pokkaliibacter sp. CJK22405]|uniref:DsbA family oxidoreductase n=1 Tax=Pokkaliibacter sp. CJK22405 TaxID=3384615 RepID=UPI003984F697